MPGRVNGSLENPRYVASNMQRSKDYMTKTAMPVLTPLVTAVAATQPSDPVAYMLNRLDGGRRATVQYSGDKPVASYMKGVQKIMKQLVRELMVEQPADPKPAIKNFLAARAGESKTEDLVPPKLRAKFEAAGQAQVFKFVDRGMVTREQMPAFIKQLEGYDLEFINNVFKDTVAASEAALSGQAAHLEPLEKLEVLADSTAANKTAWYYAGLDAIAAGQVGALVLAGGQGTRLGFNRPKGEYNLGLPSQKVLFKLQADRILKLRRLAAARSGKTFESVSLPYYVMTSPMTDGAIRSYFSAQKYLGLGKENVVFFSQGTLPCFSFEGKIVLERADKVAEAPDGNGGIYRALHLSGTVADMERRGVQYIHAFAVDNAVCKVADPVWIGYCIDTNADMGCKVCRKTRPEESVGVLCMRNGEFSIVEYSDMDEKSMHARTPSGELAFAAANLCIHFYTIGFLQTKCSLTSLPKEYHLARKKIPYADEDGITIPKKALKKNTGIKLESFIFDVCPKARVMAAMEVVRSEEFSPVKNAPGNPVDSPDSAREILSTLHSTWLGNVNVRLSGPSDALVEVSPIVSYGGEGLSGLTGRSFSRPLLVQAESERKPGRGADHQSDFAIERDGDLTIVTMLGV